MHPPRRSPVRRSDGEPLSEVAWGRARLRGVIAPRSLLALALGITLACSKSDSSEGDAAKSKDEPPSGESKTPSDAEGQEPKASGSDEGKGTDDASGCKLDRVTQLVASLEGKGLRDLRREVGGQLLKVCTLPPVVAAYLELRRPPTEVDPGMPAEALVLDGIREVHDAVCPDGGGVFIEAAAMPRVQRAHIIYDECGLGRFDLMSREAFALIDLPSLVPFHVHTWLKEQGASKEEAGRLAAGVALLAVRDWQHPQAELPGRGMKLDPVPDGIGIYVTENAIASPRESFAVLGAGTVKPEDRTEGVIPGLKDHLEREAARAKSGSTPGPVRLLLSIDGKVPYATVVDVVLTAHDAGIDDVQLLGETAELEFGALAVTSSEGANGDDPPLVVMQGAEGFSLHYEGKPLRRLESGREDPWDYEALRKLAGDFKRLYPDTDRALVSADASLAKHDDVFRMSDALREHYPKIMLDAPPDPAPDAEVETGESTEDESSMRGKLSHGKVAAKGAYDEQDIVDVVKDDLADLRSCYEKGLERDPTLAGRVDVQFVIGPTGRVPVSVVSNTTLSDRNVANCIAKAVKRFKFAKPRGGGSVVVTYPFKLAPK